VERIALLRNAQPGACIIKLFTAVIYGFSQSRVFVPDNPFQLSLMLADEARSLL
jgi:hypothetical protein